MVTDFTMIYEWYVYILCIDHCWINAASVIVVAEMLQSIWHFTAYGLANQLKDSYVYIMCLNICSRNELNTIILLLLLMITDSNVIYYWYVLISAEQTQLEMLLQQQHLLHKCSEVWNFTANWFGPPIERPTYRWYVSMVLGPIVHCYL